LTPLTGLEAKTLDEKGVSFEEAVAKVKEVLPPNAILVGQVRDQLIL
jgi:hypothetical protein